MKNIYLKIVLFLVSLFLFISSVNAQINISPLATVTASNCSTGPCSAFNDLNYGTCGTQLVWVSTSSPPSSTPGVNWIQWDWSAAESFDKITIHHAEVAARFLTGGLIQIWNGSTWLNHHTFSNLPMQCVNTITFPAATTNRMRITSFQMTGTGQTSNPNFREIEVFRAAPSAPNDAGVSELTSPLAFCIGTNDIKVKVKNYGINLINNLQVHWSIGGVPQTPVNLNLPLDTVGGAGVNEREVTLATGYNFTTSIDFKAWTHQPNNQNDTINQNDTLSLTLKPSLAGVYTVNAALPTAGTNYNNFTDLISDLQTLGVCAPVTVNVATNSGPYNELFYINEIEGASAINTVRINGNGNTLQYSNTTTDRQLVRLIGTKYLTLDNLIFKSLNSSYGWGAVITNGAAYDSITNCKFDLSTTTGTSSTYCNGITLSGSITSPTTTNTNPGIAKHCYFGNNEILGPPSGGSYYTLTIMQGADSNIFEGNTFADYYFYGAYLGANTYGNKLLNNTFHKANKTSVTTFYGIYSTGVKGGGTVISGNRIHTPGGINGATGTAYGIYISSPNAPAAAPFIIANNAIYNFNLGGTIYGIYSSAGTNTYYLHNTINIDQPLSSGTNYGMYFTSTHTNARLQNNMITFYSGSTGGTKYGYYIATTNGIPQANVQRNNVYMGSTQSGTQYHSYHGGARATLAALQAAYPAMEVGSVSVDPYYINAAAGILKPTVSAMALYQNGLNLGGLVNNDIDGITRATLPTPGAFEMDQPTNNDAGIIALIEPNGFCPGVNTIKVVIANLGLNAINSAQVHWTINGTPQTVYNYTGTLTSPITSIPGSTDTIILGTLNLPPGTLTLKAWTTLPNNTIDPNNSNDTLEVSQSSMLGGNYTINAAQPTAGTNFNNFGDLISALENIGICSQLVVDVAPNSGPYNELFYISEILGASATHTVRINGNGNALQYDNTTTDRQLLRLVGTKYLTINDLTFKSLNTSYGWGASVTGGAAYDSIINCTFDLSTTTGTSSTYCNGITLSGSVTSPTTTNTNPGIAKHCYFGNNLIQGPPSGGSYYTVSIMQGADSNIFESNTFADYYYYGAYLGANTYGNKLLNNTFHKANKTSVTTFYGIYSTGVKGGGTVFSGNRIHTPGGANGATGTTYGMYITSPNAPAADPFIVSNNAIYNINQGGTVYAFYVSAAVNTYFLHNTVNFDQPLSSGTNYGMYFTGTHTNGMLQNNMISFYSGGTSTKYGYYLSTTNGMPPANVQRNNVYMGSTQSGTQYHSYHGGARATLAALQAAYPTMEVGSVSVDPDYENPQLGDFTPGISTMTTIYQNGLNLGGLVPIDIRNFTRATQPTPGAFEMPEPTNNNAATVLFTEPTNFCEGINNVTVVIKNAGLNDIDSVRIHWEVNGVAQAPFYYTGLLESPFNMGNPVTTDTVTIGTYNFANGINYNIKAWTYLPNGMPDPLSYNDTISINNLQTAMSGIYTINPSLPQSVTNYHSVAQFTAALEQKGVCGPVVANVAVGSGPYNERVYVGVIPGTSATNTVRINGNGNTIQWNSTSSEAHLLRLTGTKYLTIDNLVFKSTSTSYGWGAMIWGGAEYDSITNCTFDLTTTTSTSSAYCNGITFNGSLTSPTTAMASGIASNCYIGYNQVLGPSSNNGYYYAMTLMQGSDNITIEGNTLANFYLYGIYMGANLNNIRINKNTIHRKDKVATTTFYGIYSTGAKTGYLDVTNNRIHSPGGLNGSTGTAYGMYFSSPNLPATDTFTLANNALYNLNQGGTMYGMYILTAGVNTRVMHNTVDYPVTLTSTCYGMYFSGTYTNGQLMNNIVSLPSTGSNTMYGIYLATTNGFPQANVQRNNVWLGSTTPPASFYHSYHGGVRATLAALQAAYPAMEVGSLSIDPQYVNALGGNLAPQNTPLNTNGLTLNNIVPEDIMGIPRPNNPAPGAFEKPISNGIDGRMVALINPSNAFCPGLEDVEVYLMNYGNQQLSNFNINWSINGVPQPAYLYNGILDTIGGVGNFSDTVMIGSGNFPGGVQVVKVWLTIANDVNLTNDTIEVTVNSAQFNIVASYDTVCKGADAKLRIDPQSSFDDNTRRWFSSTDGVNFTAITNSDVSNITATLDTHTYFFVEFSLGNKLCYSDTILINVIDPTIQQYSNDVTLCGPGIAQLTASVNPGVTPRWYENPGDSTPIFVGNPLTTPFITTTATYWVEGYWAPFGVLPEDSVGQYSPMGGGGLTAPYTTYHQVFNVTQPTILKSVDIYPTAAINSTSSIVIVAPNNTILATIPYTTTVTGGTNKQTIPLNVPLTVGTGYKIGQGTNAIALMYSSSGVSYPYTSSAITITGNNYDPIYYFSMYNLKFGDPPCTSNRVPVTITVHPIPDVDLGPDIVKCVDPGHLEFLNAANFGADYLWDNNYNGMVRVVPASGTYWVQVTNQFGCVGSDTINVTFKPNPVVDLGNDTSVCNGVTLNLNAGNDGVQYYWNTGQTTQNINVNNPGIYSVQVTGDNGCVKTDSITINMQGQLPTSGGIMVNNLGPYTFSFSCVNPLNIIGYQWSFGDGNYSSMPNPIHTYNAVGNYVVSLNLSSICGFAADSISTHIYTKIDENQFASGNITLYPNPANEHVMVKTTDGLKMESVRVLSVLGAEIYKLKSDSEHEHKIDLSGLASGMYNIEVTTNRGMITRKLEVVK